MLCEIILRIILYFSHRKNIWKSNNMSTKRERRSYEFRILPMIRKMRKCSESAEQTHRRSWCDVDGSNGIKPNVFYARCYFYRWICWHCEKRCSCGSTCQISRIVACVFVLAIRSLISERQLQAREFDGMNGISSKREQLEKKFYRLLLHMTSYQSNKWPFFYFFRGRSRSKEKYLHQLLP